MSLVGENHFYARRASDGEEVHILDAISGRGYTCLGCERDMQAVRHKKSKITDFFRHDAKYVDLQNKCTFSDQKYRKTIAITSLLLEKRIKVPSILQFPPKGEDGLPMVICQSSFVYSALVKTGIVFYEAPNGNMQFDTSVPDGCLKLYEPDIVFFNEDNLPILLVQVVIKFKVSDDLRAVLRRLRINTLQITLPTESKEAIHQSLFQPGRSKWIYTNEQQFTKYIPPTGRNTGRSELIDYIEERLHEETITCRLVQISNLIRSINRCYQSEQYIEIESRVRGGYVETKRAIEANRKQRELFENRFRAELEREYREQFGNIAIEESIFEEEESQFSRYQGELEDRYRSKAAEIRIEENNVNAEEIRIERELNSAYEALGGAGKSADERKRELEFDAKLFIDRTSRETDAIRSAIDTTTRAISDLQKSIEQLPGEFKSLEDEARRKFETDVNGIRERREGLPEYFRYKGERLNDRFNQLREQAIRAVETRDINTDSRVSELLKALFDRRTKLADIEQMGRLSESIRKGTYKNWIRRGGL